MARKTYITLISSLPSLSKTYHVEMAPISRYQLDLRLRILSEAHQKLLNEIESVLHWDHLNNHYDDQELMDSASALLQNLHLKHYDTIRDIISWRLNLRTVLAALRHKQRGDDLNTPHTQWGVGDLTKQIESQWAHPYFNLQSRMPWLVALHQAMQEGDTIGVERILFDASWQYLNRCAVTHHFDFTAVVLYVLRWNMVARWSAYDADQGVAHFNSLVDFALGNYRCIEFNHED